jgi:hypothetical protein
MSVVAAMPVITARVPVRARVPATVAAGVAVAVACAAGKVTCRSIMWSTGSAEVGAPRSVPAARKVTATAATVAAATATVLRQCRRRADQYRPQNAGRQKQAFALGTHDCHLPFPFAPLRDLFEPIKLDLPYTTRFMLFGAQQSLL